MSDQPKDKGSNAKKAAGTPADAKPFSKSLQAQPNGWLAGQMLIAMPSMPDPRFARTVVLVCSHGPEGAMGLVVNRLFGEINFQGLLKQLKITPDPDVPDRPVYFGGPVEPVRGFVLHSTDYKRDATLTITPDIFMTATIEILENLAQGKGPSRSLLTLGYAGWGAGQLDTEVQANGWLVTAADPEIIFGPDNEKKWSKALASLGVSPTMLSGDVGHA